MYVALFTFSNCSKMLLNVRICKQRDPRTKHRLFSRSRFDWHQNKVKIDIVIMRKLYALEYNWKYGSLDQCSFFKNDFWTNSLYQSIFSINTATKYKLNIWLKKLFLITGIYYNFNKIPSVIYLLEMSQKWSDRWFDVYTPG